MIIISRFCGFLSLWSLVLGSPTIDHWSKDAFDSLEPLAALKMGLCSCDQSACFFGKQSCLKGVGVSKKGKKAPKRKTKHVEVMFPRHISRNNDH